MGLRSRAKLDLSFYLHSLFSIHLSSLYFNKLFSFLFLIFPNLSLHYCLFLSAEDVTILTASDVMNRVNLGYLQGKSSQASLKILSTVLVGIVFSFIRTALITTDIVSMQLYGIEKILKKNFKDLY